MTETKPKEVKKIKNKSKYIANISLGVMGIGFFSTLPFSDTLALKILQGGFEGGFVGAVADWFAVTALFRHPLGLKIPHTALLPNNRDKLTNALLNVAQNELLNKESIIEKTKKVHVTNIALAKIEAELEKESTKKYLKHALVLLSKEIEKEKIEAITKNSLGDFITNIDTKKIVSSLIDKSIESKYDEKIYTVVFNLIEKKISDREVKDKITEFVIKTIEKKAENNLFKFALKPLVSVGRDKLTKTIDRAIDDILADLKDENSDNRKNILSYIQKELHNLKDNQSFLTELENKKNSFVEGEQFDKLNGQIADTIVNKINSLIEDDAFIDNKVLPFIKNIFNKVKNNQELIDKIENGIKNAFGQLIDNNHAQIGNLIKENVDKLSIDELTDMMENKIGKELSWIRVNGAICGFLVGLVLCCIKIFI